MLRSMYSGVAGLINHQIRMDAIGNNIANVNTVGYKSSRVTFQDALNQTLRGASAPNGNRGGINPVQIGLGMNLASIDILGTQGNLQNTGRTTDVAIQGDGFFIVNDGNRQYYTRAGNFNLERDGRLVNASNGMIVQGWLADNLGNINANGPVTDLRLPLGQIISPIATTHMELGGNLASNTNINVEYAELALTDPDKNPITVNFKLTPIGFNEWNYTAEVDAQYGSITGGTPSGTIKLNENGVVVGTGGFFEVTPKNGTEIRIEPPRIGQRNGGYFAASQTGTVQDFTLGALTGAGPWIFNRTVRDANDNPCDITYTVTALGNDRYQWQVSTPNVIDSDGDGINDTPDAQLVSGGIGTFQWTSSRGVYNVEPSTPTVIKSTAANAKGNVTINPPSEQVGNPFFSVTELRPVALTTSNRTGSVPGTLSFDVRNGGAASELLTRLTFTTTGGAPPYDYVLTVDNGTVLDGADGTVDGAGVLATTSTGPIVIKLNNGVELTIPNGVDLDADFGLQGVGSKNQQVEATIPEPVVTMTKVYDSLGKEHMITTTAIKVGDNHWTWQTTDEYNNPIGNGDLYFDSQGNFVSYTGGPITFTPFGAQTVSITPDFSNLRQCAGALDADTKMAISEFNSPYQDGYPMGQLDSINIDKAGRIVGVFSNGMNQNLGQIAIAYFTNPGGLTRTSDTLFEESSNSGQAQIGQAGQGGRGQVTPGAIEMSNVDLSQEFTDMITTERGFQANSRIITTSDEMLQELVNLKR